jgi:integrase
VLFRVQYKRNTWRDVDLDGRVLRVMQNVHRVRREDVTQHMGQEVHGFRFGPAKTHRSRRPVSIPRDVVDVLKAWKPVQAEERLRAGSAWSDLDLVFTDARGHPLNPDRVRRDFYRALKAADVRRVVLYALRHTSATLTLAATKDLKLVAARLGHTSELLVLRTYGHLLPGADREAADRLGEAVRLRPDRGGHTNGTSGGPTGTEGAATADA